MERNLEDLDLNPHWDRVSEAYADARIAQHIRKFDGERPRRGLENVDKALRAIDAPPGLRLHYMSTLAHLARKSASHAPKSDDVSQNLDSIDVPTHDHDVGRE